MTPKKIDVTAIAQILRGYLSDGRRSGDITPQRPASASKILREWRHRSGTSSPSSSVHVRQMVHHLRAQCGVPVGSNGDGYWLCVSLSEWEPVRQSLIVRANSIKRAADYPRTTMLFN